MRESRTLLVSIYIIPRTVTGKNIILFRRIIQVMISVYSDRQDKTTDSHLGHSHWLED